MKPVKIRIIIVFLCVFLVALLLCIKLFFVQIINGDFYKKEASAQYGSGASRVYDRGSIYFINKDGTRVSAATIEKRYIVAINPQTINLPDELYSKLSAITTVDKEIFYNAIAKKDDPYEEVIKGIKYEEAQAIRDLEYKGVVVSSEGVRSYPAGKTASHVIGFVGFKGDKLEGRYGVERTYEDELNRDETDSYQNFFAEIFHNVNDALFDRGKYKDADIELTIEPHVQEYLEERLVKAVSDWSAESGGALVIEPKTGAIRAMVAYPSFDPNFYKDTESISYFTNPLVESVFELGSIVKPITIASAIDQGVINRNTTYIDEGMLTIDGKTFGNFDGVARGRVPIQEILNQSLNTGTVFAMQKMGKENFKKYLESFGLIDVTGIDLPNEAHSLTDNLSSSREIEFATASFGQGVAFSPISLVRALGALGNGGYLMKPYVVSSIVPTVGTPVITRPIEQGHPITNDTSEEITRMLVEVVDTSLRGGVYKMPRYSIAAKTGTAQISKDTGGYYDDRYLHAFFGYFPAYDPEFLVFYYLVYPKNVRYASETLTEPFMDTTEYLIHYYEIPPDR